MMLTYDEIPADRRTIGDACGRLGDEGHNGVLGVALAQWMARDDTRAEPEVRRAANTAMDMIDAMLAELHLLRSRLRRRDPRPATTRPPRGSMSCSPGARRNHDERRARTTTTGPASPT